MFKIDLQNIQAIGDAHIVIEENTIVEFVGDNSNGKSVISKLIQGLTSGDITHPDVRRTLIKDGTDQGVAVFTSGQKQLGLILKPKTSDSLIMYKPNINDKEENTIFRVLNDTEGVKSIVRDFGFRVYADGDICLQLHPTWGAIPFITTSGAVNDVIVQDITVDKVAEDFINSFKTITFPVFKDKISRLEKERDHAKTILETLEAYDWRAYEDMYKRMSKVYQSIKDYQYMELEEIPIPNLSVIPVKHHTIKEIPIVNFYDLGHTIADVSFELDEYIDILDGVCPTCGRPFDEHTH